MKNEIKKFKNFSYWRSRIYWLKYHRKTFKTKLLG
jgi:hypothetical protein